MERFTCTMSRAEDGSYFKVKNSGIIRYRVDAFGESIYSIGEIEISESELVNIQYLFRYSMFTGFARTSSGIQINWGTPCSGGNSAKTVLDKLQRSFRGELVDYFCAVTC
jgi:hypothetical protein